MPLQARAEESAIIAGDVPSTTSTKMVGCHGGVRQGQAAPRPAELNSRNRVWRI